MYYKVIITDGAGSRGYSCEYPSKRAAMRDAAHAVGEGYRNLTTGVLLIVSDDGRETVIANWENRDGRPVSVNV